MGVHLAVLTRRKKKKKKKKKKSVLQFEVDSQCTFCGNWQCSRGEGAYLPTLPSLQAAFILRKTSDSHKLQTSFQPLSIANSYNFISLHHFHVLVRIARVRSILQFAARLAAYHSGAFKVEATCRQKPNAQRPVAKIQMQTLLAGQFHGPLVNSGERTRNSPSQSVDPFIGLGLVLDARDVRQKMAYAPQT